MERTKLSKKDKIIYDLKRWHALMSLPRITPRCTPTPRSVSATSLGADPGMGGVYRPYPPPELTSTWTEVKFPGRVNPLSPTHPKKRINMAWETTPQHWHNERRRLAMQQREHERYHSAWARPFYGPPADKEAYRRHFREVLKQQMSDLDQQKKSDFKVKVQESVEVQEYDRQCKNKDFGDFVAKFNYLKNFRDDNKKFMEKSWENNKVQKIATDRYDREVMRYNPINWSGTLS